MHGLYSGGLGAVQHADHRRWRLPCHAHPAHARLAAVGARGNHGVDQILAKPTMRAELIGHFKACMTEIYLHIDARMADYIRTHPYVTPGAPPIDSQESPSTQEGRLGGRVRG